MNGNRSRALFSPFPIPTQTLRLYLCGKTYFHIEFWWRKLYAVRMCLYEWCLCECVFSSAISPLYRMHVAADLYTKRNPNEIGIDIGTSTVAYRLHDRFRMLCHTPHFNRNWIFSHIRIVGVSDAEQPCRWQCFCARIFTSLKDLPANASTMKSTMVSLHFCRNVCVSARFSHTSAS